MYRLTCARLKELLSYAPDTGHFVRLSDRGGHKAGSIAGVNKSDGYVELKIDTKSYKAHRLAWLYMTGGWPADEVDHIDGNPGNNVWTNLRAATHAENLRNSKRRSDNQTGLKGVSPRARGGYVAVLSHGRKSLYIGYYKTPEEAHAAYCEAAAKLHGEFFRAT